jgi:phage tail sheath protein FI
MGFSRELIAAFDIDEEHTQALPREGLNLIVTGPAGRARLRGSVTMGRGSESHRKFASLPVRRLCLQIVNSIDRATRWSVYEPDEAPVSERIHSQVTSYLSAMEGMGAFESDRFVVECDDDLCHRDNRQEHGVTILIGFHPLGCKEPVSFTLHQTVAGCRVASSAFAPVMENCA